MRASIMRQLARTLLSIVLGAAAAGCARNRPGPEPAPVVVSPVDPGRVDGGAQSEHVLRLVYQVEPSAADASARAELALKVTEALRRRLELLGIQGATVEAQGDRIEVRLPRLGGEDFENAKAVLSKGARFEFRMVDDEQDFIGRAVAARGGWDASGGVELQQELASEGQGKTATTHFLSVTRHPGESMTDARKRLEESVRGLPRPASGTEVGYGRLDYAGGRQAEGWRTYLLLRRTELDNEQIAEAEAQKDELSGGWSVAIRFTSRGAAIFEQVTAANIRKRLAIMLDGEVKSAPVIMSAIAGGRAVITMGLGNPEESERESRQLEMTLRSGALAAPIVLLIEDTIPPR